LKKKKESLQRGAFQLTRNRGEETPDTPANDRVALISRKKGGDVITEKGAEGYHFTKELSVAGWEEERVRCF